jgi:hypothetical protein
MSWESVLVAFEALRRAWRESGRLARWWCRVRGVDVDTGKRVRGAGSGGGVAGSDGGGAARERAGQNGGGL